jgi:8-oxo-dGTP pyrophosphatase MutT (NUDIX family)
MSKLFRELELILKEPLDYGPRFHDRQGGRVNAAVLALFSGPSLLESDILLIKRSLTVMTHAGQVALPGGGVEEADQNDCVATALRETYEEVGLQSQGMNVVGLLPSFPTVSGGYFVSPVLGVADRDTRSRSFTLDSREVGHCEWVSVAELKATRSLEKHMVRGVEMELPFFQWGEEKMWGLTALIFDLILRRYDKLEEC